MDKAPTMSRDFFALFKAVSSRNASAMARIGEGLLKNYPALDQGGQVYILSITMLGFLANNEPKAALELWNQYRERIFGNVLPGGTLQAIFAVALDRYKNNS